MIREMKDVFLLELIWALILKRHYANTTNTHVVVVTP